MYKYTSTYGVGWWCLRVWQHNGKIKSVYCLTSWRASLYSLPCSDVGVVMRTLCSLQHERFTSTLCFWFQPLTWTTEKRLPQMLFAFVFIRKCASSLWLMILKIHQCKMLTLCKILSYDRAYSKAVTKYIQQSTLFHINQIFEQ